MAVVKIVELIGSSLNSWEEAAGNAVKHALMFKLLFLFEIYWSGSRDNFIFPHHSNMFYIFEHLFRYSITVSTNVEWLQVRGETDKGSLLYG